VIYNLSFVLLSILFKSLEKSNNSPINKEKKQYILIAFNASIIEKIG
jgi:hypothetical protein